MTVAASIGLRSIMTASFRKLLLAAVLSCTAVHAGQARDREVTLSLGTPSRLALNKAFEAVIIAEPMIVDVRTDDSQSVLIEPRRPGVTNLVFVDAQGRVIANVRVIVCELSGDCDAAAGRT